MPPTNVPTPTNLPTPARSDDETPEPRVEIDARHWVGLASEPATARVAPLAKAAQARLAAFGAVAERVLQDWRRSVHDPADPYGSTHLVPRRAVFAMGTFAHAVNNLVAASGTLKPASTDPAVLEPLTAAPEALFLAGASHHAKNWWRQLQQPTDHVEARALCFQTLEYTTALTHRHATIGVDESERDIRAGLMSSARELARAAIDRFRVVEVRCITETHGDTYVAIPTLAEDGIVLAAWAQWSEHLALRETGANMATHDDALVRLGSVLMLPQPVQNNRSRRPARATMRPAPQPSLQSSITFFNEVLARPDALARVAEVTGTEPAYATQTLNDLRIKLTKPAIGVVR